MVISLMNDCYQNRLPVMTSSYREPQKVLRSPFRKITLINAQKLTRVQVYSNLEVPMTTEDCHWRGVGNLGKNPYFVAVPSRLFEYLFFLANFCSGGAGRSLSLNSDPLSSTFYWSSGFFLSHVHFNVFCLERWCRATFFSNSRIIFHL
jgi:hypothetical protein